MMRVKKVDEILDLVTARERIRDLEDAVTAIKRLAFKGEAVPTSVQFQRIQRACHTALTGHVISGRPKKRRNQCP